MPDYILLYHFNQFISHMTFYIFKRSQKIGQIEKKSNLGSKKIDVTHD